MIQYNMSTQDILNLFFHERNSSTNTKNIYTRSVKVFEEFTNKKLDELMKIADTEETNNINWKNSTLKPILIEYRVYLYKKYKERTADTYFTTIQTIFRHFEITIGPLPYFSTKNINKAEIIYAKDLPNREILEKAMLISHPLMNAVTTLMSSTGISRIDVLNLQIKDYLQSTIDYHHSDNIYEAIQIMEETEIDIIPCFYLKRQKTGREFFTFASPESVRYINAYLLSRGDKLRSHDRLFKVNERYFNGLFQKINDMLMLGRVNNTSRFGPHMLRKYHASQLAEAGMSTDKINILQGRKNHDIAHMHYIKYKVENLRDEYIGALPYLVIQPITRIKTELDVTKEELESVSNENIVLKEENIILKDREEKLNDILRRLQILEQGD